MRQGDTRKDILPKIMTFRPKNIFFYLQTNQWIIIGLLFLLSLLLSLQNISLGVKNFGGGQNTHYNNYVLFKNSFFHLVENKNLYSYYCNEYADLYKYSPTFASIMAVFYYLPDSIGLIVWNSLNIFVLYYALYSIKSIDPSRKIIIILYLLFELILSTQNSQCNSMLAGLTITAFNMLEKGKNTQATLFIVLGTFIKIYSIVGCVLLLLYPNKLKSILSLSVWLVLFFLLPLLVVDFSELIWQYKNWYTLLGADQNESIGMSFFSFTQFAFPLNYFKLITLAFGTIIIFTPLLKFKLFACQQFRLQYMALILIWMVVFNYKAESPTYVIAMAGIGVWLFTSKKSKINSILAILTLLFTSIWFTDIIPNSIKNNFIDLKFIKSFFPILILIKLYFDLIFKNIDNKEGDTNLYVAHSV
ncbi:MAG: DUF2029 domain-containing protein [Bacteroidetes bacterium]|nr:DUF2029 domain-containing protein [Bacteroidota bacterium]